MSAYLGNISRKIIQVLYGFVILLVRQLPWLGTLLSLYCHVTDVSAVGHVRDTSLPASSLSPARAIWQVGQSWLQQ